MIYQFIENLARMIMEWAIDKQDIQRHIVDVIKDQYSHTLLKKSKV